MYLSYIQILRKPLHCKRSIPSVPHCEADIPVCGCVDRANTYPVRHPPEYEVRQYRNAKSAFHHRHHGIVVPCREFHLRLHASPVENYRYLSAAALFQKGLAVGANVLIARLIGSGRHQHIPDAVHTAMLFSVVIGVLLGIAGQFVSEPLLMLINTPENIIGQAAEYLRIYFAGVPFLMIYDFGSAVLRSKGDSRRPLAALLISGVINLLLNLLFVIVFRIDVIGVALATDISTAISALMVTYWLMREQGELRLSLRSLRLEKDCLRKIAAIGIPAALQGAVFCICQHIYTVCDKHLWQRGCDHLYQPELRRRKYKALPQYIRRLPCIGDRFLGGNVPVADCAALSGFRTVHTVAG